jgi:uncharacterized protein (DUF1786 family)
MTQKPIIALDIGGGTQDILLYNPLDSMENAVKLVVPSPTVIAAKRLARATDSQKDVFLSGRVMGGGSISRAVKKHLEAGFKVYSLKDPAMTIHDNLDKVASMGVEIVDNKPDHEVLKSSWATWIWTSWRRRWRNSKLIYPTPWLWPFRTTDSVPDSATG